MSPPRIVTVAGSPAEMGRAHGLACRDEIRRYTAERVALAGRAAWAGRPLSRAQVLELARACVAAHRDYAPELVAELDAIGATSGVTTAELIATNGFTDFVDLLHAEGDGEAATDAAEDDCTAFIVPDRMSADGRGFLGQTWDMHAGAAPYVLLLSGRPLRQPAFLSFSLAGCVGMIGMNEAGIAVGINNLLGRDGQVGVTWPFVVRKALQQSELEAALACITEARLAGAHNYLLRDRHGNGINVEAMPGHCHVTRSSGELLAHSNHCLDAETLARSRPRLAASQASSEARLARARHALAGGAVTPQTMMALTRDAEVCVRRAPPLEMETCGAVLMQPAAGQLWALAGLPDENEYVELTV